MDSAKNSKGLNWILTLVSVLGMVALLILIPEWSWVALPFVLTFLAKAFDVV